MDTLIIVIVAVAALLLGVLIAYLIMKNMSNGLLKKAEAEAEIIKKNKIVEAKEKFIALKLEHENKVKDFETRARQ